MVNHVKKAIDLIFKEQENICVKSNKDIISGHDSNLDDIKKSMHDTNIESNKKIKQDDIIKGIKILEKASEDGGADADFILSYLYAKKGFEYGYEMIKKDDEKAKKYLKKSIKGGSALGTIGALFMKLISLTEIKKMMKYVSLKDAYVVVLDVANRDNSFFQYIVAEVYYYKCIYIIENLDKSSIDVDIQREMKRMCAYWYDRAMNGGIFLGFLNYAHMYMEYDAFVIQDEISFRGVLKRVSDRGLIDGKIAYVKYLCKKEEYNKAYDILVDLTDKECKDAYMYLGLLYLNGYGIDKDYEKAKKCFENSIEHTSSKMGLGILYANGCGVEKNTDVAVKYFIACKNEGNIDVDKILSNYKFVKGEWIRKKFSFFSKNSLRELCSGLI